MSPARIKKAASKAKPTADELVAGKELELRLGAENKNGAGGQLRLLDIGIGDFSARIPRQVIQLLADADPIDVADAVGRAQAARKTWQDLKATLELRVRLAR